MYPLSKYFIYYIKLPYNISTRSFIKKINEPLKFFLSIQKKFKTFITKNKNSKKSQISISTLSPEHTNSKRHFTSPALTINPHLHTPHIITLEYHNSGRKQTESKHIFSTRAYLRSVPVLTYCPLRNGFHIEDRLPCGALTGQRASARLPFFIYTSICPRAYLGARFNSP